MMNCAVKGVGTLGAMIVSITSDLSLLGWEGWGVGEGSRCVRISKTKGLKLIWWT